LSHYSFSTAKSILIPDIYIIAMSVNVTPISDQSPSLAKPSGNAPRIPEIKTFLRRSDAESHDFDSQTNSLQDISRKIFSARSEFHKNLRGSSTMLLEEKIVPIPEVGVVPTTDKDSVTELVEIFDYGLVGLPAVRDFVIQLSTLLLVNEARMKGEKDTSRNIGLHMSFTGASGTGKTFVAHRMAEILRRMGFLRTSAIISVGRDDLVGQFIGHTAPKTRAVLKNAMGGILFIDHADTIYRPNSPRDYGSEAIEILLQVMENSRDDLIVIMAGFTKPMEAFFSANPGLSSRITHHLKFDDYTFDELIELLKIAAKDRNAELTERAYDIMKSNFIKLVLSPGAVELRKDALRSTLSFSNARSVTSMLDLSQLILGRKLLESNDVITISDLIRIDADSVPIVYPKLDRSKVITTIYLVTMPIQYSLASYLIGYVWPIPTVYSILAILNGPQNSVKFCSDYLASVINPIVHIYTYATGLKDYKGLKTIRAGIVLEGKALKRWCGKSVEILLSKNFRKDTKESIADKMKETGEVVKSASVLGTDMIFDRVSHIFNILKPYTKLMRLLMSLSSRCFLVAPSTDLPVTLLLLKFIVLSFIALGTCMEVAISYFLRTLYRTYRFIRVRIIGKVVLFLVTSIQWWWEVESQTWPVMILLRSWYNSFVIWWEYRMAKDPLFASKLAFFLYLLLIVLLRTVTTGRNQSLAEWVGVKLF
jgi:probable Rubsico expression protein CbbX